jgi:DNA polymerase
MAVNEAIRRQYLQLMGISCWQKRSSAPAKKPREVVAESVETAATVAADQPAAVFDADSMDWPTLTESILSCRRCELHSKRKQAVVGVGSHNADWMFVGEAPGAEEDRRGEPFVGPAGKLLNAMLFALGLKREDVYIANVLKCRPPQNRDPQASEVAQCEPYLLRQIELIQPRVIIALGRHAAHSLLKTDKALNKMRGDKHLYHDIPTVVTYHPAYLLRNPADKAKAWQDLCLAKSIVEVS